MNILKSIVIKSWINYCKFISSIEKTINESICNCFIVYSGDTDPPFRPY